MDGNPVHEGHIALLKAALEHSQTVDIFLSMRRKFSYVLPYEVRRQAIDVALQDNGLTNRVQLLSDETISEGLCKVQAKKYDYFVMGSDVANHVVSPQSKFRNWEREYFYSFSKYIVLQRLSALLDLEAEQEIRSRMIELIVCPPKTEISSRGIRQAFRAGRDISSMILPKVWPIIQPHISCFHLE